MTGADSSVYIAPVIKVMSFQRCQQFLQHVCELLSAEELRRARGSVTVTFTVLGVTCSSEALSGRTLLLPLFHLHLTLLIWEKGVCG